MVSVWPKRVKTQFASLALRLVLFLLQDISFRSPSLRGRQNFVTVPLDFFLSLSLSTAVLFRFSCPVLFFFPWAFTTLASFRWENVSEKPCWILGYVGRNWSLIMALDLHYPSRDAVQALRSNIVEVEVEIFGSNLIFVFFFWRLSEVFKWNVLIRVYGLKVPFPLHKLDFKLVFDLRNCWRHKRYKWLDCHAGGYGMGRCEWVCGNIHWLSHIFFFIHRNMSANDIREIKQTSSQISQN